MRRAVIALALLGAFGTPAGAQNGRQIVDFLVQQADQEIRRQELRQQERQRRQIEERQRAEHQRQYQQMLPHWQACHGGDPAACDRALASPVPSFEDRQQLLARRTALIDAAREARERAQREEREAAIRGQAAALARERAALAAEAARLAELHRSREPAPVPPDPPPATATPIAPAVAAATSPSIDVTKLALAGALLVALLFAWRPPVPAPLRSAWVAALARLPRIGKPKRKAPSEDGPAEEDGPLLAAADTDAPQRAATTSAAAHDPVTAAQALRLAHAYLEEVDAALDGDLDDPSRLADHRSTLALAARQLDIAARADPGTALEIPRQEGAPLSVPQAVLRAAVLTSEAQTYVLDKPVKAIGLLIQATGLDPEHGPAHAMLGRLYFSRRDKARAIAAFERALALAPDDIGLIKALDRARNLSAAEGLAYRATRAAATTLAVGAATAWGLKLLGAVVVLLFFGKLIHGFATGDVEGGLVAFLVLMLAGLCIKATDAARDWLRANVS